MKTEDSPAPAPPASDGRIAIHNRLPPDHRCRAAVDEVFRVALRGLAGPWDVSIYPVDRAWVRVDVVAPDGATWSTSVRAEEGRPAEELADTVRAACVRHCRLEPASGKRRAGKQPGSQRGSVASVSSPVAPKGTPE